MQQVENEDQIMIPELLTEPALLKEMYQSKCAFVVVMFKNITHTKQNKTLPATSNVPHLTHEQGNLRHC